MLETHYVLVIYYSTVNWFSWTFTNSNIKQVVLPVKNSFTWTKQNNSKNKKSVFCVIVHVLSTIVMNLILYSGCHDIILMNSMILWSLRYIQDLCTPVWGKDNCFNSYYSNKICILYKWFIYTCSWFSWTFTNSNIKQVVLHVQNSFTWTKHKFLPLKY
jgi:hypothetical protein